MQRLEKDPLLSTLPLDPEAATGATADLLADSQDRPLGLIVHRDGG